MFQFASLENSISDEEMGDFKSKCKIGTMSEGDKNQQFHSALTKLVTNTFNPHKDSCEYSATYM